MLSTVKNTYISTLCAIVILSGCSTFNNIDSKSNADFKKQDPLRTESVTGKHTSHTSADIDVAEPTLAVAKTPPIVLVPQATSSIEDETQGLADGPSITVNFNQMPLPSFINEVFSKRLGLSYTLDPGLNQKNDLVTLTLAKPQSPADLYRTAKLVLADYGISIRRAGEILRFVTDIDASGSSVPLLISGKALPEVPPSHRPVFSIVPLSALRTPQVMRWILELYKGMNVELFEDSERNAILLKGPFDVVRQVTDAIKALDQPLMQGRHVRIISPSHMPLQELNQALFKILRTEGYAITTAGPSGDTILMPVPEVGKIVVFANKEEILEHVIKWALELDRMYQENISDGIFSYEVQNIEAGHIVNMLSQLEGEIGSGAQQLQSSSGDDAGIRPPVKANIAGGSMVVDRNLNVIYFKGPGKTWLELLPNIKAMDQPIPSVLLEVLLAEVTLNNQEDSGIEWLFREGGVSDLDLTGSTLGGLDLGGSGLTLTFESAGSTRAILNAFYRNSRAVIRSSPRILVKSGEKATIDVGNDIPIITSKSQSTDGNNAPVIQTIQYRKTGVLLKVKPIVQASGLVDIEISQELSEQQLAHASSTGSPIILTRKIETTLTLRDGGSVLLGGLISNSQSEGEDGIPLLGKIPVMGKLFRTNTVKNDSTELLILIVPYVIKTNSQALELTEAFRRKLGTK